MTNDLMESAHRRLCAALATVSLALAPSTLAAQEGDQTSAPLRPLKACQAEVDPTTRLACFDRVSAAMIAANESGDLRVLDREEVQKTRRSLFGFSLPNLGIFGRGDDEDVGEADGGFDVLNTTIAGVAGNNATGYLITTAEGAVWRTDETPTMSPKVGQPVEIRSSALSAYYLRIDGQRGVKGRRVR